MGETMRVAEAVRKACLDAAISAYEEAGISGLCADGRWELALSAIRNVDIAAVLRATTARGVNQHERD